MFRRRINQTSLQFSKHQSLFYTPNHTWVRIINHRTAKVGLSKYACECLEKFSGSRFLLVDYTKIVPVGTELNRMELFGSVDTKFKDAFDLNLPLSGRIKKINTKVLDDPYILNKSSERIWIVEIEPTYLEEETRLLFLPDQYRKICERCDGITVSSKQYIFDGNTRKWYVSSKLLIKKRIRKKLEHQPLSH